MNHGKKLRGAVQVGGEGTEMLGVVWAGALGYRILFHGIHVRTLDVDLPGGGPW